MFSDRLGSIGGIKGKVKIELFNADSGSKEFGIEKDNLILNRVSKSYARALRHYMVDKFPRRKTATEFSYPVVSNGLFNRVVLSNEIEEPTENEVSFFKDVIGFANCSETYAGTNKYRGTINLSESFYDVLNHKIRMVFDWGTNAANGSFQSVGMAIDSEATATTARFDVSDCYLTDYRMKPMTAGGAFTGLYVEVPINEEEMYLFARCTATTSQKLVNLVTGIWQSQTYMLKDPSGLPIARIHDIKVVGNEWWVLSNANAYNRLNTFVIYKIPVSNLTGNATSITSLTAPAETTDTTTACFEIVGGRIFVYYSTATTRNDASLGVPVNKVLYEYSATFTIVGRIQIPTADLDDHVMSVQDNSNAYKKVYEYTTYSAKIYEKDGNLHLIFPSGNYALRLIFDITENEVIGYIKNPYASGFPMNYVVGYMNFIRFNNKLLMFFAPSNSYDNNCLLLEYVGASSLDNLYGLLDLGWDGGKLSRVLLPAPVTKINTQTLKVTYDIVFPDDIA